MIVLETVFLSIVGATFHRYFILILPALWMLGAVSIKRQLPYLLIPISLLVAVGGLWTWHRPPGHYAWIEERSAYQEQVKLIQKAVSRVVDSTPAAPSTATGSPVSLYATWPLSDALAKDFLGYASRALPAFNLNRDDIAFVPPAERARVLTMQTGSGGTDTWPVVEARLRAIRALLPQESCQRLGGGAITISDCQYSKAAADRPAVK